MAWMRGVSSPDRFPLTPALSLGERENLRSSVGELGGAEVFDRRPGWPPLPKAEGRDEGEDRTRSAIVARLVVSVMVAYILLASALIAQAARPAPRGAVVLLEAEQFASLGGWVVDQQFMDQMGSPYLLAHGLGEPVRDAETTAQFPAAGTYRIWVRTRDWVAPWKAPGAPGRFKVLVDGKPLGATFGTEGAEWHWQDGGRVKIGSEAKVALHDLTGFE